VARTKIMLRLVDAGNLRNYFVPLDVDRLTARRRDAQFNAVRRSYHIGHEVGASPTPSLYFNRLTVTKVEEGKT